MLVLTRKLGEQIVIGGEITVTVLSVQNGRVKLGFDGPGEVPIHRAELQAKIAAGATAPIDGLRSPLCLAECT